MTSWDEAAARSLVVEQRDGGGTLLDALHALLNAFGYIDGRAIPMVAHVFNRSRAEVTGVVSFYKDFRNVPPGRQVVKVCRAEACQAMGGERLVRALEERLATPMDATTADGAVTLETVYCLGNCALSPAVLVDGKLYGRVDAEALCARLAR
jgi:formate dehydrogenase subunit gamma